MKNYNSNNQNKKEKRHNTKEHFGQKLIKGSWILKHREKHTTNHIK